MQQTSIKMVKYLYISIFLLIFARGIVGGHVPMIRAKLAPPFPFVYLGQDLERVSTMSKRSTTEDFVRKATLVHDGKYNYDKVNYVSRKEYVCITCPIHGDFWRTPAQHLTLRKGCTECSKEEQRKERESNFLARSTEVHKGVYGYSLVKYVNSYIPVQIECSKHGMFWQTPALHAKGCGCPSCGIEKIGESLRMSQEEFVARANKVHGDNYDYTLVQYKTGKECVDIKCNTCGKVFQQTPQVHLLGCGCPFCSKTKPLTTKDFIQRAKLAHGDKYDYSKVEYKNMHTKVCIICPIHGEFWQEANVHINGGGCMQCAKKSLWDKIGRMTTEEFVRRAKKVHKDRYDYSIVEYKGSDKKVDIICPIHGVFKQKPFKHLAGQRCPHCLGSKGEEEIVSFLNAHSITFQKEYMLKNVSLFCPCKIFVDFYLPSYNCFIEYNGQQHYNPVGLFGGQERFERQQERDNALRQYCREYKIKLIEIPYTELNNIESILKEELKIKDVSDEQRT